jgi:hypothetical protein
VTLGVVRSGSADGLWPSGSPSSSVPVPSWSSAIAVPVPSFPAASPAPTVVNPGDGTFTYADGQGEPAGTTGQLLRYRVAVEGGIGINADEFAVEVDAVLSDPRSWTASGVRLQWVDQSTPSDFEVVLASPVTSQQLCRIEGMETEQYTNCRLRGKVVINAARWLTGIPDYGAPLSVYRAYAVNHEVGHELGQGHELCPGPGQPAPVMQQQTLGLQGCLANPWPFLSGVRYQGPVASQ